MGHPHPPRSVAAAAALTKAVCVPVAAASAAAAAAAAALAPARGVSTCEGNSSGAHARMVSGGISGARLRASRAMGGRPGGRREWAEYTPPLVATLDELNLGEVALATGSGGGCPGVGGLANRAPLARGAQRAPLLLCGAPAAAPVPRPAVGRRRRCSEARGGIGGKAGREDAERPGRRPRREQRRRPHGSARRRGCALVRHFGVQGKKRALCGRLLSKQAPLLSPQGY